MEFEPVEKKVIGIQQELKACQARPSAVPEAAPIACRTKLRRVLLIQPPAFSNNIRGDMNPNAPLGIAYIAAVLERFSMPL